MDKQLSHRLTEWDAAGPESRKARVCVCVSLSEKGGGGAVTHNKMEGEMHITTSYS